MPLDAGTRLGPYEITAPIGQGGMGEVYRARDTTLDRDVAIKVLPEELASDDERVARFEREAKLLASLNHPNIAGIYGFEHHALILELVEGSTLADRIAEGPIPVDETLAIAKQIAEALEAGHEAGIIHRDLKPANIKVKEDGTVKVLDYGLAKALEGEAASGADPELSQSPTLTRQGTQVGVILGTAAYMSPEQAKGKRVDKRTDIWAFGAVVYEMLTGVRAFEREDVSDTLASVLRAELNWDALHAETPASLRRVLRLCLAKDIKGRFRDIGDVHLALREPDPAPVAAPTSIRWRTLALASSAAAIAGIAAGVLIPRAGRPKETPRPVARVSIPLPEGVSATERGRALAALSHDGTRLAYMANGQLYYRKLDDMETVPIRGTEGATAPFFSPDGEWIAFWARGELRKASVEGGATVSLGETEVPMRGRWHTDGTIVFGTAQGGMRVSSDGGTPEIFIHPPEPGDVVQGPQFLPGSDAVLFTVAHYRDWADSRVVVESLDSGESKVLVDRGSDARYLPTGHLIYFEEETLFAIPFDVSTLAVTGSPVPVVEEVRATARPSIEGQYAVSDTGELIYLPATDGAGNRTLTWVDRAGREEPLAIGARGFESLGLSPDGSRLAFGDDVLNDVWIWDFARETLTQLTFSPSVDMNVMWTPDGSRVAFASARAGIPNMYWKAADGAGAVERLSESTNAQFPRSFTPDGKDLIVFESLGNRRPGDIAMLSAGGSVAPLLASEFDERHPEVSRDGRWLAYQSNASGRFEIYVRPFPNVEDSQWRISRDGGTQPLWSEDGRELFYLAPGSILMAVSVEAESAVFRAGSAKKLFGGAYFSSNVGRTYDVSSDGQRFLMIKEGERRDGESFILVQNWFEELRRLVPVEN